MADWLLKTSSSVNSAPVPPRESLGESMKCSSICSVIDGEMWCKTEAAACGGFLLVRTLYIFTLPSPHFHIASKTSSEFCGIFMGHRATSICLGRLGFCTSSSSLLHHPVLIVPVQSSLGVPQPSSLWSSHLKQLKSIPCSCLILNMTSCLCPFCLCWLILSKIQNMS